MRIYPFVLAILLAASPLQASIEAYQFDDPKIEADYKRLIAELRCLVCQNQNLAESDADLAGDLRHETYNMLVAGQSPRQVVDFMVERYGDFVLYRPRFQASTWLLWLGPFVLLLVVLVLVVRRLRATARPVEVDAETIAEARRLLEQGEAQK